jgi:TfoX/Sxy family transcriptional regulator of competence genes
MAYNTELADRISRITSRWKNTDSKKMFGGICELLNGNMVCGVHKDFLILRLGEEAANEALELPFVRPFDITGRAMKGWVMVEEEGFKKDDDLKDWLNQAKKFVASLPPK